MSVERLIDLIDGGDDMLMPRGVAQLVYNDHYRLDGVADNKDEQVAAMEKIIAPVVYMDVEGRVQSAVIAALLVAGGLEV